jgi:hypothetical protein
VPLGGVVYLVRSVTVEVVSQSAGCTVALSSKSRLLYSVNLSSILFDQLKTRRSLSHIFYLFHMKNEGFKNRANDHAHLLARRSLTSKPRSLARAPNLPIRDGLVPEGNTHPIETASPFAPNLLAAQPTQTATHSTVAATKPTAKPTPSKAPKPKHTSNAKGTTLSAISSATAKPTMDSSKSQVSGIAIGLAFGLIGFAILVIGVVWMVRRRKTRSVRPPVPRWKEEPLGISESMAVKPDNSATALSNTPNRKSDGYLRLGDEKAMEPLPPKGEKAHLHVDPRLSIAHNMVITPPGSTYNNPSRPASLMSSLPSSPGSGTAENRELATVQRAFLPSLPDELHIQQGETIEIVNAFDDGWALCLNSHGEKGVVPLECLSRGANKGKLGVQEIDRSQWRLSKRASSLYAGVSPDSY